MDGVHFGSPVYILELRADILDVMASRAPGPADLQSSLSHHCLSPFKVHPALSLQCFKKTFHGSVGVGKLSPVVKV